MPQQILIASTDVEKLKQKARKLKRADQLPHHQALDLVAQDAGFMHWHHVCESAKAFEPTEKAFYSGCIVAMDIKDGMDFDTSDGVFVEDKAAWTLCRDDLFESFSNSPDEDDPDGRPIKETCTPDELQEWFQDDIMNYVFFRLTDPGKTSNIHEVLALVKERSFWPPQIIWFKGEFYDTYDIPATDADGNVVGIRF